MAKYIVTDLTGNYSEEAANLREAVAVVTSALDLEYSNVYGDGEGMVPALPEGFEPYSYEISAQGYQKIETFITKNKGLTRYWQYADGTLGTTPHSWVIEKAN